MNLYGFAGGDPVTYSDPFGLCPVVGFLGGPVLAAGTGVWCAAELLTIGAAAWLGTRNLAHALRNEEADSDNSAAKGTGQDAEERHALPGEGEGWTKLRGAQGWRDAEGRAWNKDKKHKDHWDVSDRKGKKVQEVDFEGRQIWPDGPKNKNKSP